MYYLATFKIKKYQASEFHHLTWLWLLGLLGGLRSWLSLKGCKVQPKFQISPALKEWQSVGIRLRPLDNAAYVACLPLLCQGSEWLNGKSVWLVFRRSRVQIPAGLQIFSMELFLTLSKKTSSCNSQKMLCTNMSGYNSCHEQLTGYTVEMRWMHY